MLDKILDNPLMFIVIVIILVALQAGAYLRMRHEENLRQRNHHERRQGIRVLPGGPKSRKRRKNTA